jgi:hypothetical protein
MIHIDYKHELHSQLNVYVNGVKLLWCLEVRVPEIEYGKEVNGRLLVAVDVEDGKPTPSISRPLRRGEIDHDGLIAKWIKSKVVLDTQ